MMTAASLTSAVDPVVVVHRRWAAAVLAALGTAACGLAAADVTVGAPAALRAVATVVFLVLGPGWAVAGFLRSGPASLAWSVAVAVGCALDAIAAGAMLATGLWHPVGALVVVALLCLPPLIRHAVRSR